MLLNFVLFLWYVLVFGICLQVSEARVTPIHFSKIFVTLCPFRFLGRFLYLLNRWQDMSVVVLPVWVMESFASSLTPLAPLVRKRARRWLCSGAHLHPRWVFHLSLNWVMNCLNSFLQFLLLILINIWFINHFYVPCIVLSFIKQLSFLLFLNFFLLLCLLVIFNNILVSLTPQLFGVKIVLNLSIPLSLSLLIHMADYKLAFLREFIKLLL